MSDEIRAALETPLEQSRVKTRDAGRGRQVPYLEGHDLIATANRIFGFNGWSYRIEDVSPSTTTTGRIFYRAVVTVTALGSQRTDVGVSTVELSRGEDTPEAHDTAIKGAATDALKRALRTFGAQFGNDLYDKSAPAREQQPRRERSREDVETRLERAEAARPERAPNVGELLSWALKEHQLSRAQVLEIVGVSKPTEITDLAAARTAVEQAGQKLAL